MILQLETVLLDERARDGTWCTLPYSGHKKGCPNFPKCVDDRPHFNTYDKDLRWLAVVFSFDLKAHAEEMKKRPRKNGRPWTEAQARCVLYWQEYKVRKPLRAEAMSEYFPLMGDVLLDIPEANGVNVFATMGKHGVILKARKPDLIHKVMLVGKFNSKQNSNQEVSK